MGLVLNIHVYRSGTHAGQYRFDSDVVRSIRIGRMRGAEIQLDDAYVSRVHAVIELTALYVSLIDAGSKAGVTVKGQPAQHVLINHGDQVAIGDTTLLVGINDHALAAPLIAPSDRAPATSGPEATTLPPPKLRRPGDITPVPPSTAGYAVPPQPRPGEAPLAPGITPQSPAPYQRAGRISTADLVVPAIEGMPHPGLPKEAHLAADNRMLEIRYYWGTSLLGLTHYVDPKQITIGENTTTDFFISSEGLPAEAFPIIRFVDDEYQLCFTDQMTGEIEVDDRVTDFETLRGSGRARRDEELTATWTMVLPTGARLLLNWGSATFAMRFVPPLEPVAAPFFKNFDFAYINALIGSVLLHTVFLVTAGTYPYGVDDLFVDELLDNPDRFVEIVINRPELDEEAKEELARIDQFIRDTNPRPPETDPETDPGPQPALGTPEGGGRGGGENETDDGRTPSGGLTPGGGVGIPSGPGNPVEQMLISFRDARLAAPGAAGLADAVRNIGRPGLATGTDGRILLPRGPGLGPGESGPGIGPGPGRTIGPAGIDTGVPGGAPEIEITLGPRKKRPILDIFSPPTILGALSRDAIRKVIDAHKKQIRYCYELALRTDQDLEGRVLINWIIKADGRVDPGSVRVKESTIDNTAVESCIIERVKTWRFPEPAGGGVVEVNYPFVFRAL